MTTPNELTAEQRERLPEAIENIACGYAEREHLTLVCQTAHRYWPLYEEHQKLQQQLAQAREALEFYANWENHIVAGDNMHTPMYDDQGARACQALALLSPPAQPEADSASWRDAIGASPSKPGDLQSEHYIRTIRGDDEAQREPTTNNVKKEQGHGGE